MSVYEIPLKPAPQTLFARFPNGVTYQFRLIYEFTPNDCWALAINDASGAPILASSRWLRARTSWRNTPISGSVARST